MTDKKTWDEIAEEYYYKGYTASDWELGYYFVNEMLGNIKGKTILDYGCGSGKFTRHLRNKGAKLIGVDISENAIKIAKEKSQKDILFKTIKNSKLDFINNDSIDTVISTYVFCAIKEANEIQEAFNQIYSKLKSKGDFVMLDPHPDSTGYHFISVYREKPKKFEIETPVKIKLSGMKSAFYDYYKSVDNYIEMMENAGFEIKEIRAPLAKDSKNKNIEWKDEIIYPPNIIIKAQKMIP
ncbi:MAG: class I SAM-dependent methyltransferase [Nanoarchaeota archaeon]|nr:class I SAM-dependent methyltransferase [Nanoarchaeota archaeon]MBU1321917.1 class I SAM-dependent methyltransferase [Nanoarchaeota archaeon]MBU1597610.1 class I SAM-dependent methyltransferase [Nanoarchaeota archaeon]MBU2440978.1 class I SAM-dependent methyltransferase [Nanoarchaeota archaeon]